MNNKENDFHLLLKKIIEQYENSLEDTLDIASLVQKNPVAFKWKCTYTCYVIRETACWRFVDLTKQSIALADQKMIVGSRILARAAIETIATLCYINKKMENVTAGELDFFEFEKSMSAIYAGSREFDDAIPTTNALTLIKNAEKKYPDLQVQYEHLCESAHPSWSGLTFGYSKTDKENYITKFGNFWLERFGLSHEGILFNCMEIFEYEYNERWISSFENLENWIEKNDSKLESEKPNTEELSKL